MRWVGGHFAFPAQVANQPLSCWCHRCRCAEFVMFCRTWSSYRNMNRRLEASCWTRPIAIRACISRLAMRTLCRRSTRKCSTGKPAWWSEFWRSGSGESCCSRYVLDRCFLSRFNSLPIHVRIYPYYCWKKPTRTGKLRKTVIVKMLTEERITAC